VEKSKTRAEKPSSFSFQHSAFSIQLSAFSFQPSAFSIHSSAFLSPVSCPLSPQEALRQKLPSKNPVFLEKSACRFRKILEKPRNQLVKPEGKIPRSSKHAENRHFPPRP
jgi:hypothetical protein